MNLQFTKLLLRHCLLAATLLLFTLPKGYGQTTAYPERGPFTISAKAKFYDGKVYLRWEPKDFNTLLVALDSNFYIKRWTTKENGVALEPSQMQSTVQEWRIHIATNHRLESIGEDATEVARMALYEPSRFQVTGLDDNPMKKAYEESKIPQERLDYIVLSANQKMEYAEVIGLGLTDHDVQPNNEYEYMVTVRGVPISFVNFGKAKVETRERQETSLGPLHTERGDSSILLKWRKPVSGLYSSYNIYRTIAGGVDNFGKRNLVQYLYSEDTKSEEVQYEDKLPDNTTYYKYYVVGVDDFGLEGEPSQITDAVRGRPKPLGVVPFINQTIETSTGKIEVKWDFPAELQTKISGFEIRRSEKRDGDYVLIQTLGVGARSYLDLFPKSINFYVIVAKDINDYDLISSPKLGQLEDNTPPAQVTEVEGTVSEDGSAYVKWKANTELDLLGYQVLVSNNKDTGYVVVTESWLNNNEFYYYFNVQTLSEQVWVQIGAIDYHHNRSILSVPYRLGLPDLIPPTSPVLLKAEPVSSGILIEWRKSESSDVVKHKVQRKLVYEVDAEWETIKEFPTILNFNADTTYIDTMSLCRAEYDYRVSAEDEVPHASYSSLGRATFAGNRCNHPVINPIVFYSSTRIKPSKSTIIKTDKGIIIVCWDFPCASPVYEFKLYRRIKTNGQWSSFILVKSISPEDALNKSYFQVTDKNGNTFTVGSPQPFGIGSPGSGSAIEGGTPNTNIMQPPGYVPSKKIRASLCNYTIEDDDFNTLLNLNPGDEVEYSLQAEFTDGTVSHMSAILKP